MVDFVIVKKNYKNVVFLNLHFSRGQESPSMDEETYVRPTLQVPFTAVP